MNYLEYKNKLVSIEKSNVTSYKKFLNKIKKLLMQIKS